MFQAGQASAESNNINGVIANLAMGPRPSIESYAGSRRPSAGSNTTGRTC